MIRPIIPPAPLVTENIEEADIGEIKIDRKCRDDSTAILIALQTLYTIEPLREKIFGLLDKEIPLDLNHDIGCGRMKQWRALVIAIYKQGMDFNIHRLLDYVNNHRTLRRFLGYDSTLPKYDLQRIIDNVSMLSLESLAQVGEIVAQAKLDVTRKKPWRLIRKAV